MASARVAVLLVAAGPGTRLGADRPKAFVDLEGRPLLAHALDSIGRVEREATGALGIDELVIVVPASHLDATEAWQRGFGLEPRIVAGGAERQDSVRAGLDLCTADLIVIHDAARPFVTAKTFLAVAATAIEHGAAIAALPAVDTVKIVDDRGRVVSTPPRERVWMAQTPQAFRREIITAAHAASIGGGATDDASLVEAHGSPVQVVAGDAEARKVTTPDDLRWAEWMLRRGRWPR